MKRFIYPQLSHLQPGRLRRSTSLPTIHLHLPTQTRTPEPVFRQQRPRSLYVYPLNSQGHTEFQGIPPRYSDHPLPPHRSEIPLRSYHSFRAPLIRLNTRQSVRIRVRLASFRLKRLASEVSATLRQLFLPHRAQGTNLPTTVDTTTCDTTPILLGVTQLRSSEESLLTTADPDSSMAELVNRGRYYHNTVNYPLSTI